MTTVPSFLPSCQSKQEAAGQACEVVKVEVQCSLTKEQLLDTLVSCGESTVRHHRHWKRRHLLLLLTASLIATQASWCRRRRATTAAAWCCCCRVWRRRPPCRDYWEICVTAWTTGLPLLLCSSTLVSECVTAGGGTG